jgi:hypothetical protein
MVDALNKRAHEMHVITISIYMTKLKDIIVEATNSDQHYLKIKETLQCNLQQEFKYYELQEDGILMYRGKVYASNYRELENTLMR